MNKIYRYTLLPVILGANWPARLLADRLLWRFHVQSYIMSEHYHPALLLSPSLHYRKLSAGNGYSDFILHELIHFAQEHPDKLLVLIGMTPFYHTWMQECTTMLEPYYIYSEPTLSFLASPYAPSAEKPLKGERA